MNDLDAIFFCYKQPYATYKTLQSFKEFYPSGMVYLISDNGYDYSKMAEYFGYKYLHLNENINLGYNKDYKTFSNERKINDLIKYIKVWENVFQELKSKYIIKLEDDVKIVGKIEFELISGTIFGPLINKFPTHVLNDIDNMSKDKNEYYSGHGGCIYNRLLFLECLRNEPIVNKLIEKYLSYNLNSNIIVDDQFFSLLVLLNKQQICNNLFQFESGIKHNINQIKTYHQFKNYYNYDYKLKASIEDIDLMSKFGF
jgi:hypothetical protein